MLVRQHDNGSAQPNLSVQAISQYPIPLPSISEQEAIVAVLNSLDDKIEQNRRTGRALETLARATFKAWFVDFEPVKAKAAGQTSFPGMSHAAFAALPNRLADSDGRPTPEGWSARTIADICSRITSGGTPRTGEPSYWGGTLPWLSSGETGNPFIIETEKKITEAGVSGSSTRLVRAGSTVIASAGQGKTRGQTSLLFIDSYINQSVLALEANERASDYFLFLSLYPQYEELRRISDAHSSRGSLTKALVGDLQVTIPPRSIVEAFDVLVAPMFDQIRSHLNESSKLAVLRDYLLPRLLSGRVRVASSPAEAIA
jgi:type I restriction enzyme S subunit